MPDKIRKLICKRACAALAGDGAEVAAVIQDWLERGWYPAQTIVWRSALIVIFDTWVPEEEKAP